MCSLFAIIHLLIYCSSSCTTTTYDSTLGSETLPRKDSGQAIAYDENTNTVLIVGGWDYPRQLVTFNPSTGIFTDETTSHTNFDITYGSGQQHATIGNTMYMINNDGTRLTTISLQSPYTASNPGINIPTTVDYYGCLAAAGNYVLVIGGTASGIDNVQIYNTQNGQWTNGQNLRDDRGRPACVNLNDKIYVIGGYNKDIIRYDTIQYLDVSNLNSITTQQWQAFPATLPLKLSEMRAVPYVNDIIVIGGRYGDCCDKTTYTNKVHVIHTLTETVSECGTLQGGEADGEIGFTPSIIVGSKLYVFAGYTWNDGAFKQYQYINLPATDSPTPSPTLNPTPSPTLNPTPSPTANPTANPLPAPTANPTPSPTSNPTLTPTSNPTGTGTPNPTLTPTSNPAENVTPNPIPSPTRNPTRAPTNNPTQSGSNNPSTSPTKSPTNKPTRSESPTNIPTNAPVKVQISTTIDSKGKQGLDNANDNFFTFDMVLLIIGIVLFICVICLLVVVLIKLKKICKKSEIKKNEQMNEMVRVQSATSVVSSNGTDAEPGTFDLKTWLADLELMEYYKLFIANGFGDTSQSDEQIYSLTNEDLKEMGVIKVGHRKLILHQIQKDQQALWESNKKKKRIRNSTQVKIISDNKLYEKEGGEGKGVGSGGTIGGDDDSKEESDTESLAYQTMTAGWTENDDATKGWVARKNYNVGSFDNENSM